MTRRERDYGTPAQIAVTAAAMVTLTIDGQTIRVPKGTSVMRAAAEAGLKIPSLCATDRLEAFGSCRMCAVEIEGRRGFPASCHTPAEDGMTVRRHSERLETLRKGILELYLSDHPLDCLICPANGDCELQDLAGEYGLRTVRYGVADGAHHQDAAKDESNPYFSFDPTKCIVCSRCVRACDEVQGTFALTVAGRGFDSRISVGPPERFFESDCVSCGACVDVCPTAALEEKSVIAVGAGDRTVATTCAYCGVGCSFIAEVRGETVVRMRPDKSGGANAGHACVKGRFAWGYASHRDRVTTPMIRDARHDPWRPVSWDEAFAFAAAKIHAVQARYGREAVGAIASSRCTNEETYLVQRLARDGFGVNNIDTCARVCHSPTGYGLKTTFGTSAGTQDFASVDLADVIFVIGANPTDGHPVFASRLKRRLRQGAALLVADPRAIDLTATVHSAPTTHLQLRPGTNVALLNALAHIILRDGLEDTAYITARCEAEAFERWKAFILAPDNGPEAAARVTGVPVAALEQAAHLYAGAANGALYYGLGVTEHAQGTTAVIAIANLAMLTGNIGRPGVGVNPLRGQNNVQGACDMGSFPHEFPGYRHVSDAATRAIFEQEWGTSLSAEPGLRIPNMFDAALAGDFKALYVQGEDIAQSDPNTQHVTAALAALDCLIVQDLFLNETAAYAHVFLPGSSFLEKDGTFTNAERRINRVRKAVAPLAGLADWEVTLGLARALGHDWRYDGPSAVMDEIARTTPTFAGVSYARLDALGGIQWPCNGQAPEGTPIMHQEGFTRGRGHFALTAYVPTSERVGPRYPLLLTTGRILTQYNVGAQTRRTANSAWHPEDLLEIHPHDAEQRGIRDGDRVTLESRVGTTTLRALLSERVAPGVVYTTFHHPLSGANVVTTENSDWATNCPEYKVTAVQVRPSNGPSPWQVHYREDRDAGMRVAAE